MASDETPGAAGPEAWRPSFASLELDVQRTLGRGAFGVVYLVCALSPEGINVRLALKRTSLAQLSEAGARQALGEAELMRRLGEESESILHCFDFRCISGPEPILELLLELAPLGDLCARIRSHRQGQEADRLIGLPEAEAVLYSRDVAAGLAHIHSRRPKVFHRDVKPANIVLFAPSDAAGELLPRAKLADFGIAKILETESSFAGAQTVIGTPQYFSPEICRGEQYDEHSDAWSLGCVLYEMACLHRPFHKAEGNIALLAVRASDGRYDKEALAKHAGRYNGLFIFTLDRLLTLDPEERYRASDALEKLQGIAAEVATPESMPEPWWLASSTADAADVSVDERTQAPTSRSIPTDSWKASSRLQSDDVTLQPQDNVTANPFQQGPDISPKTGCQPLSFGTLGGDFYMHQGQTLRSQDVPTRLPTGYGEARTNQSSFGTARPVTPLTETMYLHEESKAAPSRCAVPSRLAWAPELPVLPEELTRELSASSAGAFSSGLPSPHAERGPAPAVPPSPCAPPAEAVPPTPSRGGCRLFFRPLFSPDVAAEAAEGAEADQEVPMVFCFAPKQEAVPPGVRHVSQGWTEVRFQDDPSPSAPGDAGDDAGDEGIFSLTSLEA